MFAIEKSNFLKILQENEKTSSYFTHLAKFRKKKYEKNGDDRKSGSNGSSNGGSSEEEDEDEEDPDDSQTELFRLSMQLAEMENAGELLGKLKNQEKKQSRSKF